MQEVSTWTKKKIFSVVVLVVLIVGVPIGVYLAQKLQIFNPAASGGGSITVKDTSGNSLPLEGDTPVTNSTTVRIELNPPPAP